MEFWTKNIFNTTTQIAVDSNTIAAEYLLSRDKTRQYTSYLFNNDLTSTTLTFTFDSTQSVSRIALTGINLKDFSIYYNGSTASTFSLTTTAATTVSSFASNSETSMVLSFATTQVSSISLQANSTQVADSEKAIGWFYIGDNLATFERKPASKNYKPKLKSNEVTHRLSDGKTRVNVKNNFWETNIKFKNISQSFVDSLRSVYDLNDDIVFCGFPTTTSFDEVVFPCVWDGDWDFYEYSDDFVEAGFQGSIRLKEVPS